MKLLSTFVLLVCLASTARAATYLDLGLNPNVGVTHEWSKIALGLGLDASWQTFDQLIPPLFTTQHTSIFVFSPIATLQYFLNQDPKVRSFLETRAQKGIPIVSNSTFSDVYRDETDDWTFAAGAGLRSELGDRLQVGGAVDASWRLVTVQGNNNVSGGTSFRVFLQYGL